MPGRPCSGLPPPCPRRCCCWTKENPDVAVLDLNLAGETSTPVADVLAKRGVPFVVATGYGAEGLPPSHAHVPVLAKPYDPDDLTAALGRLCM